MNMFEYKVIPAPRKGVKAKAIKGAEAVFAHTLEVLMNDMGAKGWEFQRAETLPSEERKGIRSTATTFRNVLVFRRPLLTTEIAVVAAQPPVAAPSITPQPTVERPIMGAPTSQDAPAEPATIRAITQIAQDPAP